MLFLLIGAPILCEGIIKTINRKCKKLKNIFFGDKDLDLSNKKILITGSNSGIGLHVYKKIIDKNNILAFTNNDSNEIDKLISKKTTVIKCDFSNLENLEKLLLLDHLRMPLFLSLHHLQLPHPKEYCLGLILTLSWKDLYLTLSG